MGTYANRSMANQQIMSGKSSKPGQSYVSQNCYKHSILHLQPTVGNQAVLRFLQAATENIDAISAISTSHDFSRIPVYSGTRNYIQPKLKVNDSRDQYEQEADRIADKVLQQKMPEEEVETIDIQARASLAAAGGEQDISGHLENRFNRSSSAGSPLSRSTQSFFEPRMRHDFSNVRIHTDNESFQLNRMLRAQAFTQGRDIYFGTGQYNPHSITGLRLLAHELTHVVQQTGASLNRPAGIAQPSKPENTASSTYPASLQRSVLISALGGPRLQCYREARPLGSASVGSGRVPSWRNRNTPAVRPVEDAASVLWSSGYDVDHQTALNLFNGNPPVYSRNELNRRVRPDDATGISSYYLPDRHHITVVLNRINRQASGAVLWGSDHLPYMVLDPNLLGDAERRQELRSVLVHEMNHATRGRSLFAETSDAVAAAASPDYEPPTRGVDASWPHWNEWVYYQSEFDARWVEPHFRRYTPEGYRARVIRDEILTRYRSIQQAYQANRRFRRLVRRYGRLLSRRRRDPARLNNVWPSGLVYPGPRGG